MRTFFRRCTVDVGPFRLRAVLAHFSFWCSFQQMCTWRQIHTLYVTVMLLVPRQNSWHFFPLSFSAFSHSLVMSNLTTTTTYPTNAYASYIWAKMYRLFFIFIPNNKSLFMQMCIRNGFILGIATLTFSILYKNGRRIFVNVLWFWCFLFCCERSAFSHSLGDMRCEWKNFLQMVRTVRVVWS